MSILNSLKGLLSNELVSSAAAHLGESQEGVQKAMGGIFPTLLSSLMGTKSENHDMLSGLFNQASGDNNLIGNLISGLGGGSSTSSMGIGSSLISGLLGNKAGGVVDLIANFAGIKSSSSNSLLGIGGSLLAGFMGKKMSTEGLNMGSLMSWLGGHKDEIMSAAPAGLSALGLGGLTDGISDKVSSAASSVASNISSQLPDNDTVVESASGMKWLLPLILLGLLGAGVWYFMKGCNKTGTDGVEISSNESPATAPAEATAQTTTMKDSTAMTNTGGSTAASREMTKVKLQDGIEINAYVGGVEDKIVKFLSDPSAKLYGDADKSKDWFDFDNLNFDMGKASITAESMVQIENLAAILKAYPNLKIKVGGYTDKKGDDAVNLKLSQSRADAVFAALKNKGANAAQLVKAEGYGETLAKVDENASDEERRSDRRTSVRILAK